MTAAAESSASTIEPAYPAPPYRPAALPARPASSRSSALASASSCRNNACTSATAADTSVPSDASSPRSLAGPGAGAAISAHLSARSRRRCRLGAARVRRRPVQAVALRRCERRRRGHGGRLAAVARVAARAGRRLRQAAGQEAGHRGAGEEGAGPAPGELPHAFHDPADTVVVQVAGRLPAAVGQLPRGAAHGRAVGARLGHAVALLRPPAQAARRTPGRGVQLPAEPLTSVVHHPPGLLTGLPGDLPRLLLRGPGDLGRGRTRVFGGLRGLVLDGLSRSAFRSHGCLPQSEKGPHYPRTGVNPRHGRIAPAI